MALIAQITAQAWRVSTRSAVGWQALRRRGVLRSTWDMRPWGRGLRRSAAAARDRLPHPKITLPGRIITRPSSFDTQPKETRDALCRWFRAGRAEGQDRGLQGAGEYGLRDLDGAWCARLCRMHRRRRALWRAHLVFARGDGEGGRDRGVLMDRLSRSGD